MDLSTINWLAVIVAALSMFLLGGLWYSPALFYRQWLQANGFTEEQVQAGANPAVNSTSIDPATGTVGSPNPFAASAGWWVSGSSA